MASVIVDRVSGVSALNTSIAIKAPCIAASTANLTLSGSATAATIDGITPTTGQRILVWQQTSTSENGIYDFQSSAWTRSTDFSSSGDCVRGTLVMVASGPTSGGKLFYLSSTGINVPGSSNISFTAVNLGGL